MRRKRIGLILQRIKGQDFELRANGRPRMLQRGILTDAEAKELQRHAIRLRTKWISLQSVLNLDKQDNPEYADKLARWVIL